MEKWAVTRCGLCLSFTVALALSFTALPSPAKKPAAAPTPSTSSSSVQDSAPDSVKQLEKRLFFKNYPTDELSARVARIEKHVFGEADQSSDMQNRLLKLGTVLQQQLEEQRKREEPPPASEPPGRNGAPTNDTSSAKPANVDQNPEERARISIQAAREQEINGLIDDGVDLFQKKQPTAAREKFEQVLRLDPTNASAHFNLGVIEEAGADFGKAYSHYQQAAMTEPENRDYVEAAHAVQSKAAKQQKLAKEKGEFKALAAEANAAVKRGDYNSALSKYMELDAKEPDKALVKYNIGSIYLMMKWKTNALDYYRQAHELDPHDSKYTAAYNELNAVVKKEEKARIHVQNVTKKAYDEAERQQQQQASPPRRGGGRTLVRNAPPPQGGYVRQPVRTQAYGGRTVMANNAGGVPMQGGGVPMQGGGMPMQSGGMPMQGGGMPMQSGGMPMQGGGMPMQRGGMPMQGGGMPMQSGGMPMQNRTGMMQNGGMPMQSGGMPMQNRTGMMQNGGMPMQNGMGMMQGGAMPMQNGMGTMQNGGMPMQNGMGMMQNGAMPMQNGMGMMQNGGMPMQNSMGTMQNGAMPMQNSMGMMQNGAMPMQNGMGTMQNGAMPMQNGSVQQQATTGGLPAQPGPYGGSTQLTQSPFAPSVTSGSATVSAPTGRSQFGVNPGTIGKLGSSVPSGPGGMIVVGGTPPIGHSGNLLADFGFGAHSNGEGVTVVRVSPSTRAAVAGLQRGDDIRSVSGIEVKTVDDVNKAMADNANQGKITVVVLRNGNLVVLNL